MKGIYIMLILTGLATTANAQTAEVQQLLLNYEKLRQLKNILSDMKKGYEVVSKGYTAIKNISEGNFNIHDAFINGLSSVSPVVKNHRRVADIIRYQKSIVQEYRSAFRRFKSSGSFSVEELDYMGKVYSGLFKRSLKSLDALANVITSSKLSMTDAERLKAIDRIFAETQDKFQFLRSFNRNTMILAIQRSRESRDVESSRRLFELNPKQ
ncbi:TerB family tellurite resistance protein [Albibacterium profundi]|uniref:TerB family tellurite resistance protein n=1 Tax=Albibacterium profundi TaxID=3134906 RepID=A0ABV5CFS4_9SPHI